ncbi:hypothetical protein NCCP2495_28820 [Dietzia sp. NCCP-2495]|nr:hypothetical protein NCCP2495_28820 [Dietzia sp. NCCP-2495]
MVLVDITAKNRSDPRTEGDKLRSGVDEVLGYAGLVRELGAEAGGAAGGGAEGPRCVERWRRGQQAGLMKAFT